MKCEICPVKEECEGAKKNLEKSNIRSHKFLKCPLDFAITDWVNYHKELDRLVRTDSSFRAQLKAWAKSELEKLSEKNKK